MSSSASAAAPSNRVAVVTGASRGIGRAIALRLARDGYNIALNDLPSTASGLDEVREAIAAQGRQVFVSAGDVGQEENVRDLVSGAVEELGSVDIMVANAGIAIIKPILETSVEDWDKTFNVNSRGVFLCYKLAAEQMIKQGRGGRIIGASSVAGKKGMPYVASYSATKFSVRGLTHAAAQEWAKHGINVNAYAPGPIETDMLQYAIDVRISRGAKEIDTGNAQNRSAPPDVIASLVSYLASEEAHFITGQTIPVCGGVAFT
ncbi:acetoin reductase family protein [Agrocybe pediades]|nr:acetoin reductase family protein [Agrocybe pediades]